MKKYFTLLLLIPCFCWGQKKDTTGYYICCDPAGGTWGVSTFIDGFGKDSLASLWGIATSSGRYTLTITPKQDTIKILMLVCDTANYPTNGMLYFRKQDQMLNEGKLVWWQFGYEVWGSVTSDYTLLNVDRYGNIEPTMYLDQNKKPLPKSIIVWMSKEIK